MVENRLSSAPNSRAARPALPGSPKHIAAWEPPRRQAAGFGSVADPILEFRARHIEGPARGVGPAQTFGEGEDLGVGNAAVLITLHPDSLAARHARDFLEREDEQLSVLADNRDVIALGGGDDLQPRRAFHRQRRAPLARRGDQIVLARDKA